MSFIATSLRHMTAGFGLVLSVYEDRRICLTVAVQPSLVPRPSEEATVQPYRKNGYSIIDVIMLLAIIQMCVGGIDIIGELVSLNSAWQ